MATASEVLNAAMSLESNERAEIAHKLLLSLESDAFDENVDQAWAEEIQRRLTAIREGRVELRDWDEALSEMRQAIDSKRQT